MTQRDLFDAMAWREARASCRLDGETHCAPPPTNGTPTSTAAAESIKPTAETLRQRVLEFVQLCGINGCLREDLEIGLDMNGSTVRPRVLELIKMGKIRELPDVVRATSSGRMARILVDIKARV